MTCYTTKCNIAPTVDIALCSIIPALTLLTKSKLNRSALISSHFEIMGED